LTTSSSRRPGNAGSPTPEGRAVAVLKLERLGRSLEHLLQLLGEFDANEVRLLVHDMAIDTATPQGRLFFSMVGAFAEFERGLIAEQVREGIAYTRAHGTRSGHPVGRKPADVPFMTVCDAILRVRAGRAKVRDVAVELGVSRALVYKWLKQEALARDGVARTTGTASSQPPAQG